MGKSKEIYTQERQKEIERELQQVSDVPAHLIDNLKMIKIDSKEVLAGKMCPYCGGKTEYVDSSVIYGRSYGMIYLCKPCDAYVGVHKGTDNALGRLANAELRRWKKEAHAYFDPIAKTDKINSIFTEYLPKTSNRSKAYIWLSIQMSIPAELCHIGMFGVAECKKVVEICKKYV